MSSFFTSVLGKKYTPLTMKNNNRFNIQNPIHQKISEIDKLASVYITGYKKHKPSIFKNVVPKLREFVKTDPTLVNTRFNRSRSDVSDMSNEDYNDMRKQLTREFNVGGGSRNRANKTRRRRHK